MIMTITNTSGASLSIGFKGLVPEQTLAAAGTYVAGMSMSDLYGEGFTKGYSPAMYLDDLIKKGDITVAFATNAASVTTEDAANEV